MPLTAQVQIGSVPVANSNPPSSVPGADVVIQGGVPPYEVFLIRDELDPICLPAGWPSGDHQMAYLDTDIIHNVRYRIGMVHTPPVRFICHPPYGGQVTVVVRDSTGAEVTVSSGIVAGP